MQTPGYIALSRQMVLQRQLSMTANNIANMDTPGFKRQAMLFGEHLSELRTGGEASYVYDKGSVSDLAPGPIATTGASLDFAIDGDGYFTIETAVGPRYGRDGQFKLGADNEIVTREGYKLLDDAGQAIAIPAGAREITVAEDGSILADGQQVGRIQVVRFEDEERIVHTAEGLFKSDGDPLPAEDARVIQGAIERSNVNPVRELVNMLEIQRDYQGAHRMIKTEHDRMTRAIRELGRVEQA